MTISSATTPSPSMCGTSAKKIEINPKEPRYLKVVWGVGYKIERSE